MINPFYEKLKEDLLTERKVWLITGVAGFIGSNLLESLLKLGQKVVGLDNFANNQYKNLEIVRSLVSSTEWNSFRLVEGDICNLNDCHNSCKNIDYVLHHAALSSVSHSIEDPIKTNQVNVSGFLNIITAARDARVKRFVYAASSAIYGNNETEMDRFLSPYALTKFVNELYADIFATNYNFDSVGLRYFNIFGQRQNPKGAYAPVIPKWITAMIKREIVYINGDGQTTRDFCHVDNVVQANFLAATIEKKEALNHVYDIGGGRQISLNQLYQTIQEYFSTHAKLVSPVVEYRNHRAGDVRHSKSDISKANELLHYTPNSQFEEDLNKTINWYMSSLDY